ncbi:MAG: hydroxylase [Candidatus Omnitrophica bacterium]|nr:hydroxylase [Candidatus Omnitrophota bacterium]
MPIVIDEKTQEVVVDGGDRFPLYSKEGFRLLSDLWLKVGWDQKHLYTFTWLGRPIIQNPEDMIRMQEVIYTLKPDVIIETGIAHGGSLIFYASLCKAMEKGRVIGVDIEIRPHNRKAIEAHELFSYLTLIEGSSVSAKTIETVRSHIKAGEKILVILDSCHDYAHVLKELELYSLLVTAGSYIVATDGSQEYLNVTPRAQVQYPQCATWGQNNPKRAAEDFVKGNADFVIEEPKFLFSESVVDFRITHWPSAFIKRVK